MWLDYLEHRYDVRVSLCLFTDAQDYRTSQRYVLPVVLPIISAVESLGLYAAVTRNEGEPSASHSGLWVTRPMFVESKTILHPLSERTHPRCSSAFVAYQA